MDGVGAMRPRKTYLVGVKRYETGVEDDHGNPSEGYAAPAYIEVYGIAPTTSAEPESGRNLVVVGYTLFAPPGTVVGPLDLVEIDGKDYKVDGEPADWGRGPFGYAPGVSITLTRAEG